MNFAGSAVCLLLPNGAIHCPAFLHGKDIPVPLREIESTMAYHPLLAPPIQTPVQMRLAVVRRERSTRPNPSPS